MRRFTFLIVCVITIVAGIILVLRGPYWGYPIVVLLAFLLSIAIAGYPSDRSLRMTLAAFGSFLLLGSVVSWVSEGLGQMPIHDRLPVSLLGIACLWSAAFPDHSLQQPDHQPVGDLLDRDSGDTDHL